MALNSSKDISAPPSKKGRYISYIQFYMKLYKKGFVHIAKFLYLINRVVFSCDIPCSVKIGSNFCLKHFGLGVVMEPHTVIGNNVTCYQQVTIGGRNGNYGITVGDNVEFGCGCKVLGKLTIGNNVKIGANAVVLCSIPDNCTAVGIPARIIEK